MKSLNQTYLQYLSKYPLLTKSVTSGVLYGLNETISSAITNDFGQYGPKLLKMIFYGSFILTPISHNLYGLLNKIFQPKPGKSLPLSMKCLQILTSLVTITPILSGIFTSWVSLNNGYKPNIKLARGQLQPVLQEIQTMKEVIIRGIRTNYAKFLRSSMVTNFSCLIVAQNFIPTELWVVFFNLVYFVLGTYQNIKVKRFNRHRENEEDRGNRTRGRSGDGEDENGEMKKA